MIQIAECRVYGDPRPQGSMRAFASKNSGKIIMTSQIKGLKAWRKLVLEVARQARAVPTAAPVGLDLEFYIKRPKNAKNQLGSEVAAKGGKGDLDKHCRSVLDALTGIWYNDDAQVVRLNAFKTALAEQEPGVRIVMTREP